MSGYQVYIAFLRGINVGGHHKVPMAELRMQMEQLGFFNVKTLLNSGNVIFESVRQQEKLLESQIAIHLEKAFGFNIPVLVRTAQELLEIIEARPFDRIEANSNIRLYVSFLKEVPEHKLPLPRVSEDGSYRIIDIQHKTICSVLDLAVAPTPKGMDALEQLFGKEITTRNWNTLLRISDKL